MLSPVHFSEGARYFLHSLARKIKGPRRFTGTAAEICLQIVHSCWNGSYFRNSIGNYREFWARDFGISVDALLKLGYRREVLSTLDYALSRYSAHGGITAAINPAGRPFNFPNYYSIDSVAFIFRSLRAAKAKNLVKKYAGFLRKEIEKFCKVIDGKGLVRKERRFSAMRDYALRKSSCYDNTMVAMLAKELKLLGMRSPLDNYDFKKIIKENFWTGSYFLDDISGAKHVTADANLFPFWLGIFDDKKMLNQTIRAIHNCGLDKPFPLKYLCSREKEKMIGIEFLVPDWERGCIWTHMGPLYIQLLQKADKNKAQKCARTYSSIIEKHGTLYELYTAKGKPYKSIFYHADEGMLWAVNLIPLLQCGKI